MVGLGPGVPIVQVYHEKSIVLPDVSRVLACLYEKHVEFKTHTASYKSLLRLQASSHAPVPFYDGPTFLEESRGICRYIAEKYEHQNPFLLGKDALERASVEQWLHNEEHAFNPPSRALYCHLAFPLDEEDRDDLGMHTRKLEEVLEVYEQRLSDSRFLAGNEFTLADLVHLPNSHYITASEFIYLYDSRKNVSRWWDEISNRKSWQQVLRYMKRVEEQNKQEELKKQQQKEHPRTFGHPIWIDSRKQMSTEPRTILVPPADILSSSPIVPPLPSDTFPDEALVSSSQSTPTADKTSAVLSKEITVFNAPDGTPPTSVQSTPTTSIKHPIPVQSIKDDAAPTTPMKPPVADAAKSSTKDASLPEPTVTDLHTRHKPSPSKDVSNKLDVFYYYPSHSDEETPYIEHTPRRTSETLDAFSGSNVSAGHTKTTSISAKEEPDQPSAYDFYKSDSRDTGVDSQYKESIPYSGRAPPKLEPSDTSASKLHTTDVHRRLQAEQWHTATTGLNDLKQDTDHLLSTQQGKPSKDVKQYPSHDSEQATSHSVPEEPMSMELVQRRENTTRRPYTDQRSQGIVEDKASSDQRSALLRPSTQEHGATPSRQEAAKDARGRIPSQAGYPISGQDTNKQPRDPASVPRQIAPDGGKDMFEGTKFADSTTRAKPLYAQPAALPLPRQGEFEDAQDKGRQSRVTIPEPQKMVARDTQDTHGESKTSTPGEQTSDHLQAVPQSRPAAAKDVHSATGETIQFPEILDITKKSRGTFEETKDSESTLPKAQSLGARDAQRTNGESRTPTADQRKDVSRPLQPDPQDSFQQSKLSAIDQKGLGSQERDAKDAQATTSEEKSISTEKHMEMIKSEPRGYIKVEKVSSIYQKQSPVAQDNQEQAQIIEADEKAKGYTPKHQQPSDVLYTLDEKSNTTAPANAKTSYDFSAEELYRKDTTDDQKLVPPLLSKEPTSQVQPTSESLQEAASHGGLSTKPSIIKQWQRASVPLNDVTPMSQQATPSAEGVTQMAKESGEQRVELPVPTEAEASGVQSASPPFPGASTAHHATTDDKFAKQSIINERVGEPTKMQALTPDSAPAHTKRATPDSHEIGDSELVSTPDGQLSEAAKTRHDQATLQEDVHDAILPTHDVAKDTFKETKVADSTPSSAKPMHTQRPAPTPRHAEVVDTRDKGTKSRQTVPDRQKMVERRAGTAGEQVSDHLKAIPPSGQAPAEDALGATGDTIQSPDILDTSKKSRGTYEEATGPGSMLSKAQSLGAQDAQRTTGDSSKPSTIGQLQRASAPLHDMTTSSGDDEVAMSTVDQTPTPMRQQESSEQRVEPPVPMESETSGVQRASPSFPGASVDDHATIGDKDAKQSIIDERVGKRLQMQTSSPDAHSASEPTKRATPEGHEIGDLELVSTPHGQKSKATKARDDPARVHEDVYDVNLSTHDVGKNTFRETKVADSTPSGAKPMYTQQPTLTPSRQTQVEEARGKSMQSRETIPDQKMVERKTNISGEQSSDRQKAIRSSRQAAAAEDAPTVGTIRSPYIPDSSKKSRGTFEEAIGPGSTLPKAQALGAQDSQLTKGESTMPTADQRKDWKDAKDDETVMTEEKSFSTEWFRDMFQESESTVPKTHPTDSQSYSALDKTSSVYQKGPMAAQESQEEAQIIQAGEKADSSTPEHQESSGSPYTYDEKLSASAPARADIRDDHSAEEPYKKYTADDQKVAPSLSSKEPASQVQPLSEPLQRAVPDGDSPSKSFTIEAIDKWRHASAPLHGVSTDSGNAEVAMSSNNDQKSISTSQEATLSSPVPIGAETSVVGRTVPSLPEAARADDATIDDKFAKQSNIDERVEAPKQMQEPITAAHPASASTKRTTPVAKATQDPATIHEDVHDASLSTHDAAIDEKTATYHASGDELVTGYIHDRQAQPPASAQPQPNVGTPLDSDSSQFVHAGDSGKTELAKPIVTDQEATTHIAGPTSIGSQRVDTLPAEVAHSQQKSAPSDEGSARAARLSPVEPIKADSNVSAADYTHAPRMVFRQQARPSEPSTIGIPASDTQGVIGKIEEGTPDNRRTDDSGKPSVPNQEQVSHASQAIPDQEEMASPPGATISPTSATQLASAAVQEVRPDDQQAVESIAPLLSSGKQGSRVRSAFEPSEVGPAEKKFAPSDQELPHTAEQPTSDKPRKEQTDVPTAEQIKKQPTVIGQLDTPTEDNTVVTTPDQTKDMEPITHQQTAKTPFSGTDQEAMAPIAGPTSIDPQISGTFPAEVAQSEQKPAPSAKGSSRAAQPLSPVKPIKADSNVSAADYTNPPQMIFRQQVRPSAPSTIGIRASDTQGVIGKIQEGTPDNRRTDDSGKPSVPNQEQFSLASQAIPDQEEMASPPGATVSPTPAAQLASAEVQEVRPDDQQAVESIAPVLSSGKQGSRVGSAFGPSEVGPAEKKFAPSDQELPHTAKQPTSDKPRKEQTDIPTAEQIKKQPSIIGQQDTLDTIRKVLTSDIALDTRPTHGGVHPTGSIEPDRKPSSVQGEEPTTATQAPPPGVAKDSLDTEDISTDASLHSLKPSATRDACGATPGSSPGELAVAEQISSPSEQAFSLGPRNQEIRDSASSALLISSTDPSKGDAIVSVPDQAKDMQKAPSRQGELSTQHSGNIQEKIVGDDSGKDKSLRPSSAVREGKPSKVVPGSAPGVQLGSVPNEVALDEQKFAPSGQDSAYPAEPPSSAEPRSKEIRDLAPSTQLNYTTEPRNGDPIVDVPDQAKDSQTTPEQLVKLPVPSSYTQRPSGTPQEDELADNSGEVKSSKPLSAVREDKPATEVPVSASDTQHGQGSARTTFPAPGPGTQYGTELHKADVDGQKPSGQYSVHSVQPSFSTEPTKKGTVVAPKDQLSTLEKIIDQNDTTPAPDKAKTPFLGTLDASRETLKSTDDDQIDEKPPGQGRVSSYRHVSEPPKRPTPEVHSDAIDKEAMLGSSQAETSNTRPGSTPIGGDVHLSSSDVPAASSLPKTQDVQGFAYAQNVPADSLEKIESPGHLSTDQAMAPIMSPSAPSVAPLGTIPGTNSAQPPRQASMTSTVDLESVPDTQHGIPQGEATPSEQKFAISDQEQPHTLEPPSPADPRKEEANAAAGDQPNVLPGPETTVRHQVKAPSSDAREALRKDRQPSHAVLPEQTTHAVIPSDLHDRPNPEVGSTFVDKETTLLSSQAQTSATEPDSTSISGDVSSTSYLQNQDAQPPITTQAPTTQSLQGSAPTQDDSLRKFESPRQPLTNQVMAPVTSSAAPSNAPQSTEPGQDSAQSIESPFSTEPTEDNTIVTAPDQTKDMMTITHQQTIRPAPYTAKTPFPGTDQEAMAPIAGPTSMDPQLAGTLPAEVATSEQKSSPSEKGSARAAQPLSPVEPIKADSIVSAADYTNAPQIISRQQARPSAPSTIGIRASDTQDVIGKIQEGTPDNRRTDDSGKPSVPNQEQVSHASQAIPGQEEMTSPLGATVYPTSATQHASAEVQEVRPDDQQAVESITPLLSSGKQGSRVGSAFGPSEVGPAEKKFAPSDQELPHSAEQPTSDKPSKEQTDVPTAEQIKKQPTIIGQRDTPTEDNTVVTAPDQTKDMETITHQQTITPAPDTAKTPLPGTDQEAIAPIAGPTSMDPQLAGTLPAEVAQSEQKPVPSEKGSAHAAQPLSPVEPIKAGRNVSAADYTKAPQTIFRQQARPSAPSTLGIRASDTQGVIGKIQEGSPDNRRTDDSGKPSVPNQEQVSLASQEIPDQEEMASPPGATVSPTSATQVASAEVQEVRPDDQQAVESIAPLLSSGKQDSRVGSAFEPSEVGPAEKKFAPSDQELPHTAEQPTSDKPRKEQTDAPITDISSSILGQELPHSAEPPTSSKPRKEKTVPTSEQIKEQPTVIGQQDTPDTREALTSEDALVTTPTYGGVHPTGSIEPDRRPSSVQGEEPTHATQAPPPGVAKDSLDTEDISTDASVQSLKPSATRDARGATPGSSPGELAVAEQISSPSEPAFSLGPRNEEIRDSTPSAQLISSTDASKGDAIVAVPDQAKDLQTTPSRQDILSVQRPSEENIPGDDSGNGQGYAYPAQPPSSAEPRSKEIGDLDPSTQLNSTTEPRNGDVIVAAPDQAKDSQTTPGQQGKFSAPFSYTQRPSGTRREDEPADNSGEVKSSKLPSVSAPDTQHGAAPDQVSIDEEKFDPSGQGSARATFPAPGPRTQYGTELHKADLDGEKPSGQDSVHSVQPSFSTEPTKEDTVVAATDQTSTLEKIIDQNDTTPAPDKAKTPFSGTLDASRKTPKSTDDDHIDEKLQSQGQASPYRHVSESPEGPTPEEHSDVVDKERTLGSNQAETSNTEPDSTPIDGDAPLSSGYVPAASSLPETQDLQGSANTQNVPADSLGKIESPGHLSTDQSMEPRMSPSVPSVAPLGTVSGTNSVQSAQQASMASTVGQESVPHTQHGTPQGEATPAEQKFVISDQEPAHTSESPSSAEPRKEEANAAAGDQPNVPQGPETTVRDQVKAPSPDAREALRKDQQPSRDDDHISNSANPLVSQENTSRAGRASEGPSSEVSSAVVDKKMTLPSSQAQTSSTGPESTPIGGDTRLSSADVPATSSLQNEEVHTPAATQVPTPQAPLDSASTQNISADSLGEISSEALSDAPQGTEPDQVSAHASEPPFSAEPSNEASHAGHASESHEGTTPEGRSPVVDAKATLPSRQVQTANSEPDSTPISGDVPYRSSLQNQEAQPSAATQAPTVQAQGSASTKNEPADSLGDIKSWRQLPTDEVVAPITSLAAPSDSSQGTEPGTNSVQPSEEASFDVSSDEKPTTTQGVQAKTLPNGDLPTSQVVGKSQSADSKGMDSQKNLKGASIDENPKMQQQIEQFDTQSFKDNNKEADGTVRPSISTTFEDLRKQPSRPNGSMELSDEPENQQHTDQAIVRSADSNENQVEQTQAHDTVTGGPEDMEASENANQKNNRISQAETLDHSGKETSELKQLGENTKDGPNSTEDAPGDVQAISRSQESSRSSEESKVQLQPEDKTGETETPSSETGQPKGDLPANSNQNNSSQSQAEASDKSVGQSYPGIQNKDRDSSRLDDSTNPTNTKPGDMED